MLMSFAEYLLNNLLNMNVFLFKSIESIELPSTKLYETQHMLIPNSWHSGPWSRTLCISFQLHHTLLLLLSDINDVGLTFTDQSGQEWSSNHFAPVVLKLKIMMGHVITCKRSIHLFMQGELDIKNIFQEIANTKMQKMYSCHVLIMFCLVFRFLGLFVVMFFPLSR